MIMSVLYCLFDGKSGSGSRISLSYEYFMWVNNFVALRLWRLGARDILELPLLATSSKMETALMAGQT